MIKHCAEGRCKHIFYCNFLSCKYFAKLIANGGNPTQCPYYDYSIDYNKFFKKKKK